MTFDLDKLNLVELKAAAYDLISQMEQLQRTLQEVNKRIAHELMKPKEGENASGRPA